ncbi:MAG: hypothetical protein DHS80DRAFT_32238 [Piptocephalis tieghemiana]|nr:MAG: hypothetical protein DHS80DRAFT_32238 [Piptocephalis tieghemiana]
MDPVKDSNYNPLHPNDTPCRWTGNIGHCKDSQDFFLPLTIVSLVASALLIPVGALIIHLTQSASFRWFRLQSWNATISFYIAMFCLGLSLSVYDLILIIDPTTPYWLRHLLFDIPYVVGLSGIIPFLYSLTTPVHIIMPGSNGPVKTSRPLYLSIRALPALLALHTLFVFLRGLFIDLELPLVSDIFTGLGLGLLAVVCFTISFTCSVYGYRFSKTLRHSILMMEEGFERSTMAIHSEPPTRSIRPLSTIPSKWSFLRISPLILNKQSRSSSQHPMSATSGHSAHTASPRFPDSSNRHLTTIEARAVLGKIIYLNIIIALVTFGCFVACVLMSSMPSLIFTIPGLSKLVYILLFLSVPFGALAVLLFNTYTEWDRRGKKRRLSLSTSCTPPNSVDDTSTPQQTIVSQAFQIHEAVRTIHHPIDDLPTLREETETPMHSLRP